MNIADKFYEIMEQEDKGYEEIKKEVSELFNNAKLSCEIQDFIFATDEDAAEIHAAQQPKKQAISRLTKASAPTKPMSKIRDLLDTISEEDDEEDA